MIEGAIVPDWPVDRRVRALSTTRAGGVSAGPWGLADGSSGGLNLGANCGDDPDAVAVNRTRVARAVGSMPRWLEQVHGTDVLRIDSGDPQLTLKAGSDTTGAARADAAWSDAAQIGATPAAPVADAAVTNVMGIVLAILTADCLPVLFVDSTATVVGAAHAGWRGLADGVLERTVDSMRALGAGASLSAWFGPSIGAQAFEVGDEVRQRYCDIDAGCAESFSAGPHAGKWFADLRGLARHRLRAIGVGSVYGSTDCTVLDPVRFYSWRRDRRCGRMATLIWLESR